MTRPGRSTQTRRSNIQSALFVEDGVVTFDVEGLDQRHRQQARRRRIPGELVKVGTGALVINGGASGFGPQSAGLFTEEGAQRMCSASAQAPRSPWMVGCCRVAATAIRTSACSNEWMWPSGTLAPGTEVGGGDIATMYIWNALTGGPDGTMEFTLDGSDADRIHLLEGTDVQGAMLSLVLTNAPAVGSQWTIIDQERDLPYSTASPLRQATRSSRVRSSPATGSCTLWRPSDSTP